MGMISRNFYCILYTAMSINFNWAGRPDRVVLLYIEDR